MQVTDRRTGQVVDLPDEYDDNQILSHFAEQKAPSLAQSFIGGIQQQAGAGLAQQLAQGPTQSTLPNIGGGAMVGLTPQQAQFTLQAAQNSNVDSMQQKMEQQKQVQQGIESEKDRAQTLKLRQQELKNIIAERKIQAEQDKYKAEIDSDTKIIEAEEQTRRKELDYMNKWVNIPRGGTALNPYSGEVVEGQQIPERPIPQKQPNWVRAEVMDAAGNPILVDVNEQTGEQRMVGMAAKSARPASTAGQVTESSWFSGGPKRIQDAYERDNTAAKNKAMAEGKEPTDMDFEQYRLEKEPQLRVEAGLPAFSGNSEKVFIQKVAAKKEAELKEVLTATGQYQVRPGGKLIPVPPNANPTPEWKAKQAERAAAILAPLEAAKMAEKAKGNNAEIRFEEDGTPYLAVLEEAQ